MAFMAERLALVVAAANYRQFTIEVLGAGVLAGGFNNALVLIEPSDLDHHPRQGAVRDRAGVAVEIVLGKSGGKVEHSQLP
jgi:hypothetical protein